MASMPHLSRQPDASHRRLTEVAGMVPSLHDLPAGCSFAPRCAFAQERCRSESPPLDMPVAGHAVACWEWERVVEANHD